MKHEHDDHRNYLFTPAIRFLDMASIANSLSDIAEYMGVRPTVQFGIDVNGVKVNGGRSMELREGQQVSASVALLTASGKPAAYEKGTASWASSNDAVVSVQQDVTNELNATIYGKDGSTNGSVVITFQVDGDPDAGPDQQRIIIGTLDVTCTVGEAMVVQISTGTPTDSTPQVNPVESAKKK